MQHLILRRGVVAKHLAGRSHLHLATLFLRTSSTQPSSNADAVPSMQAKPAGRNRGQETFVDTFRAILNEGKKARAEKKAKEAAANGDSEAPSKLSKSHLKRLLTFIEPETRPIAISVATLAATTSISLVFPAAIGSILDVALTPDSSLSPGVISGGLLALFGLQSAMIVLRSSLLAISGERMSASIRKDLFRALMAQDTAFFDSQKTGDLVNRLSSDTVVLQKALTSNVANGLRNAAMILGGSGMLFWLSPSLALLSMSLIPPVALAGMSYGRYLQGQQKTVQEALGRTIDVASEAISNIKTVRAFAAEALTAKRFAEKTNEAYVEARRIGIVAGVFDGAVHFAANISLVAVLGYGGHLVGTGAMTAGDLTAFLLYSTYVGLNVAGLSSIYSDLKRAAGAAQRIFDVIERTPEMPLSSDPHYWQQQKQQQQQQGLVKDQNTDAEDDNPDNRAVVVSDESVWLKRKPQALYGAAREAIKGPQASSLITLPSVAGEVRFENVDFAYPTRKEAPILKDFSLTIPAGTSICFASSSGGGKSTVASLLVRLYEPDKGRIFLDGHDVKTIDPTWLRKQVALVSQEPSLFATTIAENIRFGRPEASDEEVIEAARRSAIHERIMSFPQGYETEVGEKGAQLSGGERARVAVARALLKDAPVIVFDESTAALDSRSESALLEEIRASFASSSSNTRPRTIISIAHRLSTIRQSPVVAVLQGGKVVESGDFSKLYANPASAFRQLMAKQAVLEAADSA